MKEEKDLSGAELVNPYGGDAAKGKQVEQMFDSIAPAYDFMNTAMTFGLHRLWRDIALCAAGRRLGKREGGEEREKGGIGRILDVATGTGDLAFRLAKRYPEAHVTGIDLSHGMLGIAERKLAGIPALKGRVDFEQGDSLALRFADNSFDLVTVAYGVRNFEHLRQGIAEMARVLRPGGVLCVIELSCPANPVMLAGYNFYSRRVIPAVGRMVSGDSRAYSYLPESIAAAPQRADMTAIMEECGLRDAEWHSLTFGVVTYYLATK